MNSIYRVSISKTEQPPDFPDRCLGCGFDHPEATYEIVTKRRVIDESGEEYLYPAKYFVLVDVPIKARRAITAAS